MILKFAIRFSLSVAILLAVQVMGVERFAGTLTENTVWSGVIEVTNNVTVAENKTLTLVAGARVALYPKVSIQGLSGSTIQISGTHSQPVFLSGMSVPSNWAALRVSGSNSAISIRYADIQAGQVRAENGATLLIEDSFLHDSLSWIGPIVYTERAWQATLRRCHVFRYVEVNFNDTPTLIEDCRVHSTICG